MRRFLINSLAFVFLAGLLVPALTFAENCPTPSAEVTTATTAATNAILPYIKKIDKFILNPILILMFFIAALYFFWGVFSLISNVDDVEARTKGKDSMLWGVIGMVIMVGAFGIITFILNTLDPLGLKCGTPTVLN